LLSNTAIEEFYLFLRIKTKFYYGKYFRIFQSLLLSSTKSLPRVIGRDWNHNSALRQAVVLFKFLTALLRHTPGRKFEELSLFVLGFNKQKII
jgi:hypothetical protein